MNCEEVAGLLNAYMDGELDRILRASVDSHLELCPDCAAALQALNEVRDRVRREFTYRKAPAGLRDEVRNALRGAAYLDRQARSSRTKGRMLAAAAASVVVAALLTPFVWNARKDRLLISEELFAAHERALMGREVDVVSSDQHTVKPWFDGKLPFAPPVTDLASEGFPLEGGRLDFAAGQRVAALVYRSHLHRIDVFIWPSPRGERPGAQFTRDGFNEVCWVKNGFVFTAVSDLNTKELNRFAGLLQAR